MDFSLLFGKQPEEIVKIFEAKGYVISGNWTEVWEAAHARAFTVANISRLDVFQDIHNAVGDLLVRGKNPETIAQELQTVLEKKGYWGKGLVPNEDGTFDKKINARRVNTILETNRTQAYNAAEDKRQWAIRDLKPFLMYKHNHTGTAVHPRQSHLALDGLIFRQDDPFWDTNTPQNGWRCHCGRIALSQRDIDREGFAHMKRDSAGCLQDEMVTLSGGNQYKVTRYTDPVTGKSMAPDPGFNYNPGRARFQPQLDQYEPHVARAYVQGVLTGPEFKMSYNAAQKLASDNAHLPLMDIRRMAGQTKYPVAVLPAELVQAVGAKTAVVQLSEDTLVKQAVKRTGQDFGLEDYWRVQEVLEKADVVVQEGDLHLSFFQAQGVWYQAVVKVTQDKSELFLQTFHRANLKDVERSLRRGNLLVDRRK